MTEGAVLLIRLVGWLLPGLLAYMAVQGLRSRRPRLALGTGLAALLVALFTKPFILGMAFMAVGAALALTPGAARHPKLPH